LFITDVRLLHPQKAFLPIVVTVLGISIDVSPGLPEKALSPIVVTVLGISIDVSPEIPEKALSPIVVTGLENVKSSTLFIHNKRTISSGTTAPPKVKSRTGLFKNKLFPVTSQL